MRRVLGLALAASLCLPPVALGHVYGPRVQATVAATQTAIASVGLQCPHVQITRQDLPERKVAGRLVEVQGRGFECAGGHGRIYVDRDVHDRPTLCKVLVHELHHVDGWRARRGEAYVDKRGRAHRVHHRSSRSIMHPRPAVPDECRLSSP